MYESCGFVGKNQYFLTKIASARHWIANFIVAGAGLVAVHSILAGLAGPIAATARDRERKHVCLAFVGAVNGTKRSQQHRTAGLTRCRKSQGRTGTPP